MFRSRAWIAILLAACVPMLLLAQSPGPPKYSTESIVHGATFNPDPVAGNTFISIFGENLAWSTRKVGASDISANRLPTALGGVQVLIGPVQAFLVFVSPGQINALVSSQLIPGEYEVRVLRDSWAGPAAKLQVRDASPGLFMLADGFPVVTRPDGSVVDEAHPARPGEIVILWATGLGDTTPDPMPGELPRGAALLTRLSAFRVELDGVPLSAGNILYAGVAPGFAGLYQINILLPENTPPNPELRVGYEGALSPAGQRIFVQP